MLPSQEKPDNSKPPTGHWPLGTDHSFLDTRHSTPDTARLGSPTRSYLRKVMFAWFLGAGWMALASGVVFYRFAREMGLARYPFAWGLLSAMPYVATALQLTGSLWAERSGRNKWPFIGWLLVQRLSWLLIAVLPFMVMPFTGWAIAWVLMLFFMQAAGGSLCTPPWTNWMAAMVPARVRGRFFARRHRLAMVMFVTMALLSGWLLSAANSGTGVLNVPWPSGLTQWRLWPMPFTIKPLPLCSILFAVGAVLGTADVLMLVRIPEMGRPAPTHGPTTTLRDILARPLRDRQFVRFLAFFALFMIGSPGTVYYIWENASDYLGISDLGAQMMLVVLPALGELTFAPVWGGLIDRYGRKTVWMISLAYVVILPVCWLFVLPQYWWLGFVIPILGNICWNGTDQCNTNWLLHLASGEEGSSSYQAVFALAVAITGTMSGLLLGFLAWASSGLRVQAGPFTFNNLLVVFSAATLIRGIAFVFLLPRVHDANRRPVGEALRYAAAVVIDAIDSTVNFPLRLFGLGKSSKSVTPPDPSVQPDKDGD